MDWFLRDNGLRQERVKEITQTLCNRLIKKVQSKPYLYY